MKPVHARWIALVACAAGLLACKPETAVPVAAGASAAPAATVSVAPAVSAPLHDEIGSDARRVIGISYAQGIDQYPGLKQALLAYAQRQRTELDKALAALGENAKPTAPYELSLQFSKVLDTPQFVAVTASGTLYTGGAHGQPLLQGFVWLPQQDRLLDAAALIASAQGWQAVSDNVRGQLHARAAQRAGDVDEAQRAAYLKDADKQIDDGTAPAAENFALFLPLTDASGQVQALRFTFPPYQVGPYADGAQSVDVPIDAVRPFIAPQYRALFGG